MIPFIDNILIDCSWHERKRAMDENNCDIMYEVYKNESDMQERLHDKNGKVQVLRRLQLAITTRFLRRNKR